MHSSSNVHIDQSGIELVITYWESITVNLNETAIKLLMTTKRLDSTRNKQSIYYALNQVNVLIRCIAELQPAEQAH